MEAGVMEELRVCQEERDILKQKLHVHLDRWTLDKIMFGEMAARAAKEIRLKEIEKSYERARWGLRLGSQQQQLLVLKLELDSALEDMKVKEIQFSALKSQLQEERKWRDLVKEKSREMKAKFAKVASEKSKLLVETERKIKQLQKLLDNRVQRHKAEVEQIEGKHALSLSQLKEEIKHLVSRDGHAKAQQIQWSVERKQLKALAREKDNLVVEQQQWCKDKEELHAVMEERDNLRGELVKRTSQQKEMQAIKDERDGLTTGKHFSSGDMEELVKERDALSAQLHDLISQGKDLQALVMERDKLKQERDLINAQRQDEVSALVRERDFVWSQMKTLDEDYGKRAKKMSEQNLQDRQEIDKLMNEMKGAQEGNNEMMVESTILKLEVKRVEDLAIQKHRALEAELQELRAILERVKEEKQTEIADALKKESLLLELPSREVALERQPDCSYQEQGAGAVGDGVKEVPEVLNAGDGSSPDYDILESQLEQATQVHRDDEKNSAKCLEELKRENENLRRETENLKVLYAELEDRLRKKPQKSAKVTNRASHRDPTSRNLKLELEAVAGCSPSDGGLITDGNVRKKNKFVPSPKKLRPRSRVDYSDSINLDRSGQEPAKRRRKVDDGDFALTQNLRPPLHSLPHNRRSSTKSGVKTPSSGRAPLPESVKKTFIKSDSKMMATLFSAAFNVPKLKTPVHFMT